MMLSREKMLRVRRHPRGFSLIELGIVIAVIAVLAAVVIFGRGFIAAGRVSKAVEGFNTVRKAGTTLAGLRGGSFTPPSSTSEIQNMAKRGLLPVDPTATTWDMAGSGTTAFTVSNIQFSTLNVGGTGGVNAVAITLKAPDPTAAEDVWNSIAQDKNLIQTPATIGTLNCTVVRPTADTNNFCFKL